MEMKVYNKIPWQVFPSMSEHHNMSMKEYREMKELFEKCYSAPSEYHYGDRVIRELPEDYDPTPEGTP